MIARAVSFFLIFLVSSVVHAASVCVKSTCVDVELMRTHEELRRGLQGRTALGHKEGMLFIFERDARHRFWMKDVSFPIDIIWIDAKGRIVHVASSCPPCLREPCPVYGAPTEAKYVLEVPAGFAQAHQLKLKDRVSFKGIR